MSMIIVIHPCVKAGGAAEWLLLSWHFVSLNCEVLVRMTSWPGRFKVSSIIQCNKWDFQIILIFVSEYCRQPTYG